MLSRGFNPEVFIGERPREFGPHAAIVGPQGFFRHAWPIGADSGGEACGQVIGQAVVGRVNPFNIRAEPDLTAQIQGGVDAKAACDRQRIDEAGKRRGA